MTRSTRNAEISTGETRGAAAPLTFELSLPPHANALVIAISGRIGFGDRQGVSAGQAITGSNGDLAATMTLAPESGAHFIVLAGPDDPAEIVTNGPFVYGSLADLRRAEARYLAGEFGLCPPIEDYV